MRTFIVIFVFLVAPVKLIWADEICISPDKNIQIFLERFKNDLLFQRSRIVYPLQRIATEPDGMGKMTETISHLTLKKIQEQSIEIIKGRVRAAELFGGEGKLCEQGPKIKGNQATLLQHSCHTDVYAFNYDFILMNGCWFLNRYSSSQF